MKAAKRPNAANAAMKCSKAEKPMKAARVAMKCSKAAKVAMKCSKAAEAMKAAKCSKAMKAAECSKVANAMTASKVAKAMNAAKCGNGAENMKPRMLWRCGVLGPHGWSRGVLAGRESVEKDYPLKKPNERVIPLRVLFRNRGHVKIRRIWLETGLWRCLPRRTLVL